MRIVCLLTCFLYVLVLKVDVMGKDYYPLEIISGDLDENSQIEYVETIVVESVNKNDVEVQQQLINLGFTETSESKNHQSMKELTRVSDLGEEIFRLYLNNMQTDKSSLLKLQYHVTLKDLEKKAIVSYYKRLNSFIATIYTDERNIYSCGSLVFHDMIESNEFLKKIIKTLDVETIDRQRDQDLHMMTGYTKQLTQYYLENTEKKNLQLASRVRSDGSVYVSIGTPILTIEY